MKKIFIITMLALASVPLCGCVVQPYPYYGGSAPYYGTTYQPGFAFGEVGGYYPSYPYAHGRDYHLGYWNHYYAAHNGWHGNAVSHNNFARAGGGVSHGGGHDGHR